MSDKVTVQQHGSLGILWFIGWLFSIGFLGLGFFKGLLALLLWPYFLGAHFAEADKVETAPVATESR